MTKDWHKKSLLEDIEEEEKAIESLKAILKEEWGDIPWCLPLLEVRRIKESEREISKARRKLKLLEGDKDLLLEEAVKSFAEQAKELFMDYPAVTFMSIPDYKAFKSLYYKNFKEMFLSYWPATFEEIFLQEEGTLKKAFVWVFKTIAKPWLYANTDGLKEKIIERIFFDEKDYEAILKDLSRWYTEKDISTMYEAIEEEIALFTEKKKSHFESLFWPDYASLYGDIEREVETFMRGENVFSLLKKREWKKKSL